MKIILTTVLITTIVFFGGFYLGSQKESGILGFAPGWSGAYSSGVTHSSSTLTNSVAKKILSSNGERQMVELCLDQAGTAGTVWLYKIATSTGVITGQGQPIFASSSYQRACLRFDASDPWTGEIWGISSVTSTVSISEK